MRNPQYTIHNIYFDAFGIYIQFFITMIEDMMVVAHHLLDQPEEVAPINSARRGLVPDGGRSHWVKIGTRKGKLIVLCGFLLLLKSSLDSVLE